MDDIERRPDWVEIAQRRFVGTARTRVRDTWPRLPEPGEIHIAEGMDERSVEPRMVCVLSVDPAGGTVEVALVSPETELATDRDSQLPVAASGLPFRLMVESDVVAELWMIQLGRQVVRLAPDHLERVSRASRGGWAPDPDTALSIQGVSDPRSLFKEEEHAALDALARDCASRRADLRSTAVVVDPAVLRRSDRESGDRHLGRLVATARGLLASEMRVVPERALDRMAGPGAQDCDTLRALAPIWEAALREPRAETTAAVRFEPDRTSVAEGDDQLGALLPPVIEGAGRSVLLLTIGDAWSDGLGAPVGLATATAGDAARLQIVRRDVEGAW
jgi:hypothetical protein